MSYDLTEHVDYMFHRILYHFHLTNAYVHIVYCIYMYNCLYICFIEGHFGRLANMAKSATLLKYCINKK